MWSELGGLFVGAGALLGASLLAKDTAAELGTEEDQGWQNLYNTQEAKYRGKKDVLCTSPRFITADCLSPTSQSFWVLLQRKVKHQVAPLFSTYGNIEVILIQHAQYAVLDMSSFLSPTKSLKNLQESLLVAGLLMSPGNKAGHFHIFYQTVRQEKEMVELIAEKLVSALTHLFSTFKAASVPNTSSTSKRLVENVAGTNASKKRRDI